jgi:hypothetical protein
VRAADEEWAVECRHFDVQVGLFTANAEDEDIKAFSVLAWALSPGLGTECRHDTGATDGLSDDRLERYKQQHRCCGRLVVGVHMYDIQ